MNHLARRVLSVYGRTHPSMYPFVVWRLSKENCENLAGQFGAELADSGQQLTMLGIPVKITESDEVLLVMKA